jgi:bifunctional pyridoxal-dependent enzyme with beta-cystathionase and maltose regulon repressor activities
MLEMGMGVSTDHSTPEKYLVADFHNRNAGFFLWIDLSPYLATKTADSEGWQAEAALKKAILNAGIEMASGAKYREETPGWFRVLFTVEKDALEEALKSSVGPPRKVETSINDKLP